MPTNGRRGQSVNMSQYIQNLNEVPQEKSPEEQATTLDEELAIFTNTTFVDWDASNGPPPPSSTMSADLDTPSVSSSKGPIQGATTSATEPPVGDLSSFDFNIGDYGFDFSNPYTTSSAVPPFSENLGNLQPIQPSPTYSHNAQRGAFGAPNPQVGDKRKPDAVPPPRQLSFEDQSRLAAEEDKRRRNTAASARFRVKKKAREQALEKSQKELNDKVGSLEGRIQTLETENKWLRELVMEKNGGNEKIVTALLDQQKKKGEKASESAKA